MAQTAAQKKALAAAQALIKKQQASLKKLEAEQKTMTDAQAAVDKQLTDDAYYTKTLASGKTQAQIDALRNAYDTTNLINKVDPTNVATIDRTTGKITTKVDPNKGRIGLGSESSTTTYTAPDGRIFTNLDAYNAYIQKIKDEEKRREGQSAYDILYAEFDRYGLGSLVADVESFIKDGLSEAEFTIKLRNTPAYQTRFAANAKRIANGFAAIDEATYIGLEDTFQSIMQNYGMPEKYYARANKLGVQQYFEDAISKNIDPVTFEERVIEGKKVLDANRFTIDAAKQFYPTLNDGDFLAYVLDSKNAISDIQRKVTAAEIGGAQIGAGLAATAAGATELAKAGITGQAYQKKAANIAEDTLRGGQLASIYKQDAYTQQTAEANILNLPGSVAAKKQTDKLKSLEEAAFSGRAGAGAIARDRAGVL